MKAFLSKGSIGGTSNSNNSTKMSRNVFSNRNSSQQVGPSDLTHKISDSIVHLINGKQAKSKGQDGTGAYEQYVSHQAVANARTMLNNQSPDSATIAAGLNF